MVYRPRYDGARWKGLRDQAVPMRDFIKHAKASGLDLPPSSQDFIKEACPSYNMNVLCNARCGRAGDHNPYPAGGEQDLLEW